MIKHYISHPKSIVKFIVPNIYDKKSAVTIQGSSKIKNKLSSFSATHILDFEYVGVAKESCLQRPDGTRQQYCESQYVESTSLTFIYVFVTVLSIFIAFPPELGNFRKICKYVNRL